MKEANEPQQKGKNKKKKRLVEQTEKDRYQHYDMDGVSMDEENEVIVSGEQPHQAR